MKDFNSVEEFAEGFKRILPHYKNCIELLNEIKFEIEKINTDLRQAAYSSDLNKILGIEAWLGINKDKIIKRFEASEN